MSGVDGLVYIHRVVASEKAGRVLLKTEHVHHKDENPMNWKRGNLQILSNREHHLIHGAGRETPMLLLACAFCGKEFEKTEREERTHRKTRKGGPFCSRSCGAKGQHRPGGKRQIQLRHGSVVAYSYHRCRCRVCKDANAERQRLYQEKKRLNR